MVDKIDLIIPVHDCNEELFESLKSLNKSINPRTLYVRTIVVDCHSQKLAREELVTQIIKFNTYRNIGVKFHFMSKSLGLANGFSTGFNVAIESRRNAHYIGFLSYAGKYKKGWLEELVEALKKDKSKVCATFNEEHILDCMLFKADFLKKTAPFDLLNISFANIAKELKDKILNEGKSIFASSSDLFSCNKDIFQFSEKEKDAAAWISNLNSSLKESSKRNVVYTFIKAGDFIPKIEKVDKNTEYICFASSNAKVESNVWRIERIDTLANFLGVPAGSLRMKNFIKYHPHWLFKNFNRSIWLDPLYNIRKNIFEVLDKSKDSFFTGLDSSSYDCAYRYAFDQYARRRISKEEFDKAIQIYNWCNYPKSNGMTDSSFFAIDLTSKKTSIVLDKIWHFLQSSDDDLLFIDFVLWLEKCKTSFITSKLFIEQYL